LQIKILEKKIYKRFRYVRPNKQIQESSRLFDEHDGALHIELGKETATLVKAF